MNEKCQITFEQAREIAFSAACADVTGILKDIPSKLLDDEYLEAEHCWFFFRSKDVVIPSESWFVATYNAYAISKKGAFSQITDFDRDPEKLAEYLKKMSDYFEKKNL